MPNESRYKSLLERKLRECEDIISKNSIETAFLFDQHGKLIFEKKGNSGTVRFSKKELSQMHGNILTHNHSYNILLATYGIHSVFSESDLHLAYNQKPCEIRMVIGDERHSFQWTHANKVDANHFLKQLLGIEAGAEAAHKKIEARLYTRKYKTHEEYLIAEYTTIKKYADKAISFLKITVISDIYLRRR